MVDITRTDTMLCLGDSIRIEKGPAPKKAIATEELLDNSNTAPHYGAPIGQGDTTVYSKDRLGNDIKLGEEMDYLDWLGEPVYYIYQLVDVDGDTETTEDKVWAEKGFEASEEAAMSVALSLLGDNL